MKKNQIFDIQKLFSRDLDRLVADLEAADNEKLWISPEGVQNSCGVLVQHLVGNLRHFIGAGLGNTGYRRNRDREFENSGKTKTELIEEVKDVKVMIRNVLNDLDEDTLDRPFPMDVPFEFTIRQFLLHLYGHLNYHFGQFNYLRRLNR